MMKDPDQPSADFDAMAPYWRQVTAILGGAPAMRAAGETYLPKFKDETTENYAIRIGNAKFTNVFRDMCEGLAARPFHKPVQLPEDRTPPEIMALSEDIDGDGNSLHTFAYETFFSGITHAVDWVLVDHTRGVGPGATIADERAAGARPYWVRYPAESVLAVYSDRIGGREEIVHARLLEMTTTRVGFEEKTVKRVRVLNREQIGPGAYAPATFEVWEEQEKAVGPLKSRWAIIDGPAPITIGRIALVPFITGRRIGRTWQFHPPMRDAADLQIDLYQQESGLKHAKTMTAFPMLSASGVEPEIGDNGEAKAIRTGPGAVLYAPPSDGGTVGRWEYLEPSATSLNFLAADIKETIAQLRELGRQPLTAQSGNLTVVTTAFAAQKGNAAIQAWAINLGDFLEQCLAFTALWLGITGYEPKVMIDTDFDLGLGDDDSFQHVLAMKADGAVSREAVIHEAKRRGILDADHDPDADLEEILSEMDGDDEEPAPLLPGQQLQQVTA